VALNLGVGVLGTPRVQDLAERILLALRAIVKRIATRINAADVAGVEAKRIVASNAVADGFIISQGNYFSIGFYDLMIAR
jgi:hypothetical protein